MILYIGYSTCEFSKSSGTRKKIDGQTKTLKKAFGEAYFTMRSYQTACLMDGDNFVEKEIAITRQDYLRILIQWIEKYGVTRTYIRYPFADRWFIELLKYQKDHKIKTVLEIPTFPYDDELASGRLKTEDAYYREIASAYVDVIATYTAGKTIWGKPCIQLMNGFDAEKYKPNPVYNRKKTFVMIGIASGMALWNGYERLIEGMKNYKEHGGALDVKLKLVGTGTAENIYRKLALNYGLREHVEFCGVLQGKELDRVYDDVDIGISTLASYRQGMPCGSPLKAAEYCARGLPMVCGYTDTRFPDNTPFVLRVPNDDTPIDIPSVIAFYEKLSAQEGYREKIHEYAVQHLSWDRIMKPVIDYLQ